MTKIEEAMKLIGPGCVCEVNLGNILVLTGALKEAIERHEAFRQEVSDAVTAFNEFGFYIDDRLGRFIIAKPDPLVEIIATALREGSPFDEDGSHDYTAEAKVIAAALAKRGLEIREKEA